MEEVDFQRGLQAARRVIFMQLQAPITYLSID